MKKIVVVFVLLGMVFISGCGSDGNRGSDGDPGNVYIAYSWAVGPISFTTSDPGFTSSYVLNDHFYSTTPGTYSGSYTSWNDSYWTFSYTLTANPGSRGQDGEKGSFPFQNGIDGKDGDDGADKYYKLVCYSTGSTLYYQNYSGFSAASFDLFYDDKLSREISIYGKDLLPLAERKKFKGINIK